MNRGDRREAIFPDDTDRKRFLDTLAEACQKKPIRKCTPTVGGTTMCIW